MYLNQKLCTIYHNIVIVLIFCGSIFCYQLQTEWCSIPHQEGRCRPSFNCFNPNYSSQSNCSKENDVCCPETNTPKLMCQEYAKSVYSGGNVIARSLSSTNEDPRQTAVCATSQTPLIIGGEKALEKEFPFMVSIGFGRLFETASWSCGGTLISEKFVISAAHCLKNGRNFARWARLGMINLAQSSPNEQKAQITKKLVHPNYKLPSFMYDIMLLELDRIITFNSYVRPACLNMKDTVNVDKAMAAGFGKLDYKSKVGSDDMMRVTLDVIPYDACAKAFSTTSKRQFPMGVHDSVLCAGVLEGGKDTCQGDSGGPLVIAVDDPFCMHSLIGITSFGIFCGFANSPAIYTRVSYFIPWIVENVWGNTTDIKFINKT